MRIADVLWPYGPWLCACYDMIMLMLSGLFFLAYRFGVL